MITLRLATRKSPLALWQAGVGQTAIGVSSSAIEN